ncbi:MAG: class I SAM-dependent methyltransferase [Actinomycetota bacterium]|nr:class I SAM-dependent methyltransferase [Actinomycetota bacterium]
MARKKPDVVWLPTPEKVVDAMLRLADVGPEDILYDLGSGDGRTAIAAVARFGVREARGVEIRPHLLRHSREQARRAGMKDRVRFVGDDLFRAELAGATVVTLYLLPRLNLKLRPRLLGELRPGSRVVSHNFGMGDWEPDRTLETRDLFGAGEGPRAEHRVHLWIVPADAGGTWRLTGPGGEEFGLELVRRFQKVHGTLLFEGGRVPLRKAKLRGDALSFAVRGVTGLRPKTRFEGRVDSDVMVGSFDAGGGVPEAQGEWTAERIA